MRFVVWAAMLVALGCTEPAVRATEITVYKSPTCGCCKAWVEHLEQNGFSVTAHDVADVNPYKQRYGVTLALASCHTAVVEGYVVEGHVPASDIKRFLTEHPMARGLAVPGMPAGSPGMESPNPEPYAVMRLNPDGGSEVYARH